MSKFLYPIYKLNIESYKKWWLYHKKAGGSGILSEILQGFSFNLENTLNRKFNLFEIQGNSEQESTEGRNLFDKDLITSVSRGTNNNGIITSNTTTEASTLNVAPIFSNIAVNNGDTIYFSCDIKLNNNSTGTFGTLNDGVNGAVAPVLVQTLSTTYKRFQTKFTYNGDTNINKLLIQITDLVGSVEIKDIMISKSSSNDYEPYTGGQASPNPSYPHEIHSTGDSGSVNETISNSDNTESQNISILTQQPMRSIGDVRDGFAKVDGVWNEVHPIYRYRLLSNKLTGFNTTYNRFALSDTVVNVADTYAQGLSNVAKVETNKTAVAIYTNTIQIRKNDNGGFNIYGWLDGVTSLEEAQSYLDNNEVYVEFPIAEPTYLPCTEEQVQALESLEQARTYKPVTHISSEDEVPAYLKIQYYKEG